MLASDPYPSRRLCRANRSTSASSQPQGCICSNCCRIRQGREVSKRRAQFVSQYAVMRTCRWNVCYANRSIQVAGPGLKGGSQTTDLSLLNAHLPFKRRYAWEEKSAQQKRSDRVSFTGNQPSAVKPFLCWTGSTFRDRPWCSSCKCEPGFFPGKTQTSLS